MPSDLIYREDAKDYARHAIAKGLNVLEYLDEVPAAAFRPVVRANLISPNPYGTCSNCNWLIDIRDGFSFCPNCGAEMEES